jgi:hypothetical protein
MEIGIGGAEQGPPGIGEQDVEPVQDRVGSQQQENQSAEQRNMLPTARRSAAEGPYYQASLEIVKPRNRNNAEDAEEQADTQQLVQEREREEVESDVLLKHRV